MNYTKLFALLPLIGLSSQLGAESPYVKPDGSYISLSGEVSSAGIDQFVLDYGDGKVLVEMDDWDWYAQSYQFLENDDVTVYGYVDDDFLETTSIEASSVYVEDLNTYFYANGMDEESFAWSGPYIYDYDLRYTGEITEIDGRELTLDTGSRKIVVDTINLGYNPVDDQGFLKVEEGDRIAVYGNLDYSFIDGRELSADALIKLQSEDRGSS